jgi:hypothetical protein
MKNLKSLLTEKSINVIANDQLFMVRGGNKTNVGKSVKSLKSHKSHKSHGHAEIGTCCGNPGSHGANYADCHCV